MRLAFHVVPVSCLLLSLSALDGVSAIAEGNTSWPDQRNIGTLSSGYIYVAKDYWHPKPTANLWAFDGAQLWIQGNLTQGYGSLFETGAYQFSSILGPLIMGDYSTIGCSGGWFCNFYFHNQWASMHMGAFSSIITLQSATLYIDDNFNVGYSTFMELFENANMNLVKGGGLEISYNNTFRVGRSANLTIEAFFSTGAFVSYNLDSSSIARLKGNWSMGSLVSAEIGKSVNMYTRQNSTVNIASGDVYFIDDSSVFVINDSTTFLLDTYTRYKQAAGSSFRMGPNAYFEIQPTGEMEMGEMSKISLGVKGQLILDAYKIYLDKPQLIIGSQASLIIEDGASLHMISQGKPRILRIDHNSQLIIRSGSRCVLDASFELTPFTRLTWSNQGGNEPKTVICY